MQFVIGSSGLFIIVKKKRLFIAHYWPNRSILGTCGYIIHESYNYYQINVAQWYKATIGTVMGSIGFAPQIDFWGCQNNAHKWGLIKVREICPGHLVGKTKNVV